MRLTFNVNKYVASVYIFGLHDLDVINFFFYKSLFFYLNEKFQQNVN